MMLNTIAVQLHEAVAAVCPIEGVSIGEQESRLTWRIDFSPAATPEEKAAAQAALDVFEA